MRTVGYTRLLALMLAALTLTACNVDPVGFLASESTPDDRFEESRAMAQPGDIDPGEDFSFIFVSDLHIQNGAHGYLTGLKDRLDGAAFVVFGGDITQNGKKEDVDCFLKEADALGVPYFVVPGNHDLYNGGWAQTKRFGPSSFSVKLGKNARLVGVDTANATLGDKQYDWLEQTLGNATEPFILVATHVQFFTQAFLETQQFTSPEESATILSLLNEHGVDLALAGHAHRYNYQQIGSVGHYVSGVFRDGGDNASYLFVTVKDGTASVELRKYKDPRSGSRAQSRLASIPD
jgi:3',5'-cyclic AMP phosphodiesterase CpdA